MQFTLRPWRIDDVDSLVQYANNSHIARFMTDSFAHPYLEENARNTIAFAHNSPSRMFAIEINGKASGGIGLHPQTDILRRNAELGYWLGEPFWGSGIMTEAVKQIVDYGFANMEETDRIFGRVFGNNTASQKVLQKAGFRLEAQFKKTLFKNGEYIDELIYAVRR